jgi:DNA-directed RNA polymerase subunit M/transcription elongation factor TFIIS
MAKRRINRPNTVPPVSEMVAQTLPTGIKEKLQYLGIPERIAHLIIDTTYSPGKDTSGNPIKMPLFSTAIIDPKENKWEYSLQEIMSIVHVYDQMKGQDSAIIDMTTGRMVLSPEAAGNLEPDDAVYIKMKEHIEALVLSKEKKIAAGVLLTDDTEREAPAVAELRRQRVMKSNLSNRKRVPIKGEKCGRCKQDSVYQEELWIRSGDEGAVWKITCATCGNSWKH